MARRDQSFPYNDFTRVHVLGSIAGQHVQMFELMVAVRP
jgi:hypothetical protein